MMMAQFRFVWKSELAGSWLGGCEVRRWGFFFGCNSSDVVEARYTEFVYIYMKDRRYAGEDSL